MLISCVRIFFLLVFQPFGRGYYVPTNSEIYIVSCNAINAMRLPKGMQKGKKV